GASPNPPLWCPTTAVPASKQLKLSVLDGNRSFDLVNAEPARYHCTSQQAILETLLNAHFLKSLESNSPISDHQCSFRKCCKDAMWNLKTNAKQKASWPRIREVDGSCLFTGEVIVVAGHHSGGWVPSQLATALWVLHDPFRPSVGGGSKTTRNTKPS
ncbi:hypothetical protein SK128_015818, partial [Halocaridina rubra]